MKENEASTVFRALDYYKHQLEEFEERDDIENKFPSSNLADIEREIEKVKDNFDEIEGGYVYENPTLQALRRIIYALNQYKDALPSLKKKIMGEFSDSPIELEQVNNDLNRIDQLISTFE